MHMMAILRGTNSESVCIRATPVVILVTHAYLCCFALHGTDTSSADALSLILELNCNHLFLAHQANQVLDPDIMMMDSIFACPARIDENSSTD